MERLAKAIGYPERIPEGSLSFTLRVDGAEVFAEETDRSLVLRCVLTDDETLLPTLASYAAGRMLKEDATLAYGEVSEGHTVGTSAAQPSGGPAARWPDGAAFLWQSIPADADAHGLLRLFETFMDSCDWWRARVDALRGNESFEASAPETVMIRP